MIETFRVLAASLSPDEEEGQGLAEYALILSLIAIVAIVSLLFLGEVINDLMSTIGATISSQTLP